MSCNVFAVRTLFALAMIVTGAAHADVVHFDSPSEYEGQFYDNSNGPVYSWSAGAGVGGTPGSVDVADDPRVIPTALYRPPFDLGGGVRHEVSAYFHTAFTRDASTLAGVGFAPSSGASFSGGQPWVALFVRSGAAGGLDYGEDFGLVATHVSDVNAVEDVDQATPASEAFSLFSGHWYKLTTGWTYGGGGRFDYDATITDYGRTGSSPDPASVHSISGSLVNSTFADPAAVATMFAGVRSGPHATSAWDEFEARAVPEPAGVALVPILGAACLRRTRDDPVSRS